MMQNSIPVLVAAFIPIAVLVAAVAIEQQRRHAREKSPQQEKLLRPPGCSLSRRLDTLQDKLLNGVLSACLLCSIAGAGAVIAADFIGARVAGFWAAISILAFYAFAIAGAWEAIRAFRRVREAQNVRLGLRGEQAVAEALHEAADAGFRVFHDLPGGEHWNIDHVAAGPRGVFLIETKARRRRRPVRNGQPGHVVLNDGKALRFPSGDDTKAIPQAQNNARWLANYLTKKTGEPVTVQPIVAVPGWFVESKGDFPVKVMNATYLTGYLRREGEKIQPAQVRRIIAALDEKCRDVEF